MGTKLNQRPTKNQSIRFTYNPIIDAFVERLKAAGFNCEPATFRECQYILEKFDVPLDRGGYWPEQKPFKFDTQKVFFPQDKENLIWVCTWAGAVKFDKAIDDEQAIREIWESL